VKQKRVRKKPIRADARKPLKVKDRFRRPEQRQKHVILPLPELFVGGRVD